MLMLLVNICLTIFTQSINAKNHVPVKEPLFVDFAQSMNAVDTLLTADAYYKKREDNDDALHIMLFLKNLYEKNFSSGAYRKDATIPKIIHQIWVGPLTPPAIFYASQESFKKLHPDWTYMLWTDKEVEKLALINRDLYEKSNNYGEKADILRYELLYKFGGFYFDVDFVCLRSLEDLLAYDFATGILPMSNWGTLANGFIACYPQHPIIKECIQTLPRAWKDFEETDRKNTKILLRSGPAHFQRCFLKVAKDHQEGVIAFPKSFFYPILFRDVKNQEKNGGNLDYLIKPETYAAHYWAGTWKAAHFALP